MKKPERRKLSKDQLPVYLTYDKGYMHCYAEWETYYKGSELNEEEILNILNGRVRVGRGITEQLTVPIQTLRLYAKAIIFARDNKREEW